MNIRTALPLGLLTSSSSLIPGQSGALSRSPEIGQPKARVNFRVLQPKVATGRIALY